MSWTPLRIGFVGTGFVAAFHLRALLSVRHVELIGVYSPDAKRREAFAQQVDRWELGPCRPHPTLSSLLEDTRLDAVWILVPNDQRLEVMREIHAGVRAKRSGVRAVACEKPLGRTLPEALEMLRLATDAGLVHGYLENEVFMPGAERGRDIVWRRAVPIAGRPYLARAAEEHSGPHAPWFWRGDRQGGGVMSDMMCHAIEVGRHLLTAPGEPRSSLTVRSVTGQVNNLKWTRPEYARDLHERFGIDFLARKVEDFARATIVLSDVNDNELIVEASTSWAYVGPGLRLDLSLLGPEYAMEFNSLSSGLKVFLSRNIRGGSGEDLVEKQNAEQGLMPVIEDEAGSYGYTSEDRHMVDAFRAGRSPKETFHDGVEVVRMIMGLYKSAELGCTVAFPDPDLMRYVPQPIRG
jgi:predicted dehydrogenase